MYLTNKNNFKIIKGITPDGLPAQVKFDNVSFTVYLDRFEYESLLLGRLLRKAGVGDLILNQLQNFIENYGYDRYEEGCSSGAGTCSCQW